MLIAKCATLFSCLQGEGSQEGGGGKGSSNPFWQQPCWHSQVSHWQNLSFIASRKFLPSADVCICPHPQLIMHPFVGESLLWHNLQFLMKELTFIHSISDRSSIVLVQIPLKTARFTSFSSSFASSRVYLSCCCCCCAPHIFNSPSVITGREGLLNCKFRNQIKFTRKNICSELQMTAQIWTDFLSRRLCFKRENAKRRLQNCLMMMSMSNHWHSGWAWQYTVQSICDFRISKNFRLSV